MNVSRQQWMQIEGMLSQLYQPVYLDCDGYLVRLENSIIEEKGSHVRFGIIVHVDATIKGRWFARPGKRHEAPEAQRFYPVHYRALYTGALRDQAENELGKREASRRYHFRLPYWNTFAAMRKHLIEHNELITLLSDPEAQERQAMLMGAAS